YAFIQIARTRKKWKATEAAKELFEKASFCLTDEAGEGKGVYAEIPKVADHIDKVVESLVSELEKDVSGLGDDAAKLRGASTISEQDKFDKARDVIRDAIEAAAFQKKDKKKKDYVSALVQKARVALADAKNNISKQSSKRGIIDALNEIDQS